MSPQSHRPIEILLVEDNPADVTFTREALKDARISNRLHVVENGDQALSYLRQPSRDQPRPDLVLLDWNLPGLSGQEVLDEIKHDGELRSLPVIVLTHSADLDDVRRAYDTHANCYITKPVDGEEFVRVIRQLEDFWLSIVKLPEAGRA